MTSHLSPAVSECIFPFVKNMDLLALMVCILLILFCINFCNWKYQSGSEDTWCHSPKCKECKCSAAFDRFSGAVLNSEPEYSESELWNRDDNSTKLVTFMLLY